MHPRLAADRDGLPLLLESVRQHAAEVLGQVAERDVVPAAPVPEPDPLSAEGVGARAALEEFIACWEPVLSASAGPRYLGFVTGGTTPAALAGDWMTATWDLNAFSSLDGAGQSLERETIAWLRSLFGLSDEHHGTFVSGATMSNTVGLAIAREWLGEQLGVSPAEHGAAELGAVRVLSGSAHSSVPKALSMLGLGRRALIPVPTLPGREAVDVSALEQALREAEPDGPCVVVANAGTVNTADFDDLRAIAALRETYGFWLHVDAAFGAFAALSPEHAHLVDGLDLADSICVDLHKWLNVPYDSAVQFTRRPDLQTAVFQNAAAYLGPLGDTPDLAHLTPENSHRLRALAAWFTLRAYGRDGHREITERCVRCARALGTAIDSMPGLRLLAPVRLNVVCFTLADDPTADRLAALTERLADEVFLTPTVLDGVPALRAAFSNWRTTEADTRRVAASLRAALAAL
ncbi:pyridoxal phosphate-dependent decarboxylase family protein [Streptomyces sp. RTd22]|uniref:pyridoxal phosphate-dependent decarboxylase family protein n=1 Tax=Streptomyces sp. RTd22 TaxID=1841249 RepID=UPI0007C50AC1|nr:aminotransferase class I/II-fold pyridoxal phosphate-dependent enzyme [Streptomyces sp. RTd22]